MHFRFLSESCLRWSITPPKARNASEGYRYTPAVACGFICTVKVHPTPIAWAKFPSDYDVKEERCDLDADDRWAEKTKQFQRHIRERTSVTRGQTPTVSKKNASDAHCCSCSGPDTRRKYLRSLRYRTSTSAVQSSRPTFDGPQPLNILPQRRMNERYTRLNLHRFAKKHESDVFFSLTTGRSPERRLMLPSF